jgi:hypothetical protein
MKDGEPYSKIKTKLSRQSFPTISYVGSIFQSLRIRCSSIFSNTTDRKFMEGELRVVLYCGILFWSIYLLSKII